MVRHGKTALNKASRVRAWEDVPLSDDGKMDAQIVASKLGQYDPKSIYSSDLMRDMDTAHIIAKKLNIPIMGHEFSLRTWDLGIYAGKLESDVAGAVKHFYDYPWEIPPGSSESFNTFASRCQNFIDGRLGDASDIPSLRPPIFVTHGRNIALVDAYLNSKNPWEADMPLPGGFALIRVDSDRRLLIEIDGKKEPVALDA